MRKLMNAERLSRLMVSLLLCLGILWPLLMSLDASGSMLSASLIAAAVLLVLTVLDGSKKGRIALGGAAIVALAVQAFLPNFGLLGGAFEGLKAISLYFGGVPAAATMYAGAIGGLLGFTCALLAYAFSARMVGFLPATVAVVLVLFAMWSLGKAEYLWYAAPALAALLLLVSQTSHEKIDLFRVAPLAAVVVALSLLLLPSGRTVIEPLNKAAMDLKQAISDYLFFTEPRNVFTLGTYGYYPMGSGRLGGEAEPSNVPVMMVKTNQKLLLRGVVKDEYTGRSWRDTSSGRRYLYVSPRWTGMRRSVFLENMPAEAVRRASPSLAEQAISIQMQSSSASTLFAPVFLRSITAGNDMVAYFNEASELFITRDLERDDFYTVTAPIVEGGGTELGAVINASPTGSDSAYSDALARYTALPSHIEDQVYLDVQNIVSASASPYDRACAIMRHLQRYYRYTLTPDAPPENQDFVTYFLYVGREGYCTYFASAMTVMCRMAGLPARYVEGFMAQPAADGFAYVTGLNAHAWTEVYFEGFGWVPFDPTPSQQNLDAPEQEQEDPQPSPSPSPSPEPPDSEPSPSPEPENPDETQEPDESDSTPEPNPDIPPETDDPPFAWWWLLIAAALIAALCVRIHLRMPDQVAKKKQSEQEKIFVYGNAAFTLMGILKRTPRSGETPLLFARRMDKQKAFPTPILPLWRMMALSNYSRMKPGEKQTARAKETFLHLYRSQKPLVRLRFMLRAAFGKNVYAALDTEMVHEQPKTTVLKISPKAATKRRKGKGRK